MTGNIKVNKGLAGVITDDTSVSKVMAETNSLTYRGYAVQDLCEKCSWEKNWLILSKKKKDTEISLKIY